MDTKKALYQNFDPIPKLSAYPDLFNAIISGEILVFIGNGVSRLAGVPSWKELALKYLDDWWNKKDSDLTYDAYEKLKSMESPLKLISICINKLGYDRETLNNKLRDINKPDQNRLKKIYSHIRDFRTGCITTNYDRFILEADVSPENKKEQNFLKSIDMQKEEEFEEIGFQVGTDIPRNKILYLHGKSYKIENGEDINDMDPIFTLRDYLNHYKTDGKGRKFLEKIFKTKMVLFIGLELNEFEIIEHISMPKGPESKHYILLGFSDYEKCLIEHYADYYNALNVEVIPFNKSNKGYKQLEYILEEWAKDIRNARINKYNEETWSKIRKIDEVNDEKFD